MRFLTGLLLAASVAVLTGCAPAVSIHPIYTSRDLTTDLSLDGAWAEQDGEIWQVRRAEDGYDATVLRNGEAPGTDAYRVHLLRLKDTNFLDVTSKADPGLGIAGHLFAKISLQGDELVIALMDDNWLKKAVQSGLAPQSVTGEDGRIILTAPTADLQRFILMHADNAEAWNGDAGRMRRVRY
ncbi:MAG: hypothetical protein U0Q18_33505 [Bryobacteraceae bacterium]